MSDLSPSIRRAARRLRLFTLAGIVLIEAAFLVAAWAVVAGRGRDFGHLQVRVDGLPHWPAAAMLLLIGLLVALALLRLVRMLRKVESGAPFGAARDLRGFAFYLFASILASMLAPPLIHAGLALTGAGGQRVQLAIDNGEALMLLVTGLLFFVARLLDEAQRLADDHSQIV